MKKILFITKGYPTKDDPVYTFVQTLVYAISDQGVDCVVIAPQTVNGKSRTGVLRSKQWVDRSPSGKDILIYQPKYVSFGTLKIKGTLLTNHFRDYAIKKIITSNNISPDIVYGHFWDCAYSVADLCRKQELCLIVATGESSIGVNRYYSKEYLINNNSAIKGVISVSTKNLHESREAGLLNNQKYIVLPNSIDENIFFHMDRSSVRHELGFKKDDFIISFVGTFNDRKGVNRLIEAAKIIPQVKLILIGSGDSINDSNQIVFLGQLPHEQIAKYLNASNVFCLPTKKEGCCNAIVEAMACGLPIISSNKEFNDDILDDTMSIRIDPENIEDISNAIRKLYSSSELCKSMSISALEKSKKLTISGRANAIINFIESVLAPEGE